MQLIFLITELLQALQANFAFFIELEDSLPDKKAKVEGTTRGEAATLLLGRFATLTERLGL
jgi:hypothetical protein